MLACDGPGKGLVSCDGLVKGLVLWCDGSDKGASFCGVKVFMADLVCIPCFVVADWGCLCGEAC